MLISHQCCVSSLRMESGLRELSYTARGIHQDLINVILFENNIDSL